LIGLDGYFVYLDFVELPHLQFFSFRLLQDVQSDGEVFVGDSV
jgi:hypothetical protein